MCRCVEEGNGKMKPYMLRSLCRRLSRACMNAPESRVELVAEHVDGLVSCFVGCEEKFWVCRDLIMPLEYGARPISRKKVNIWICQDDMERNI